MAADARIPRLAEGTALAELAARLGHLPFDRALPQTLPGYVPFEAMPLTADDLGVLAGDHAAFGQRGFGVVYQRVPLSREQLADPGRVAECLAAGGTAVLSSVHRYLPTLGRLCDQMSAACGLRAYAVGFTTPPHQQGQPVHWDRDHALLLQVKGSKRWRVHRPVIGGAHDLTQEWTARGFTAAEREQMAAAAHLTVTLTPGDVLWIPRGWPHEGVAGGEGSEHVTIGLLDRRA